MFLKKTKALCEPPGAQGSSSFPASLSHRPEPGMSICDADIHIGHCDAPLGIHLKGKLFDPASAAGHAISRQFSAVSSFRLSLNCRKPPRLTSHPFQGDLRPETDPCKPSHSSLTWDKAEEAF